MTTPIWSEFRRHNLNDGKYLLIGPTNLSDSDEEYPKKFAGYIANADHPFLYCPGMSHEVDGKISNQWSNGDGPDLFNENLKNAPLDWRYRTKKINYLINSSGYRTREWKDIDWQNSVVILGCSNTYGVGLAEDETISCMLEHRLQRPVINLGYPGGSNEVILNNASAIIERFGIPWAVVVNWTTIDRFRYYSKNHYSDLGAWSNIDDGCLIDGVDRFKLYQYNTVDEYNLIAKNYYISQSMNALWKDRTKFVSISYFDQAAHYMRADAWFKIRQDCRARDMLHPGYKSSIEVAEYLYQRLK